MRSIRSGARHRWGIALVLALICGAGVVAVAPAPAAVAGPASGASAATAPADVYVFGDLPFHGSTATVSLAHSVVGAARSASGNGYYEVASDGGVFAFGDAPFFGSTGGIRLNRPIVGIAATPTGRGYYEVASDGGIFAFGDARFFGSTGGIRLNRPIVGMAVTPSGRGYYEVASDGGIFAFGDAVFRGSTGAIHLNRDIVAMATTATGRGYWLVASDGGIFAFGDAAFFGSTGGLHLAQPIVGMAAAPSGRGYWLVARDGGTFAFGQAPFYGSMGHTTLGNRSIAGIIASVTGHGYAMVAARAPGPASAPAASPGAPNPVAADTPSPRRIWATFYDSFAGRDSLIARIYSYDNIHVRVFNCLSPTETYSTYASGFAETWASTAACTSNGSTITKLAAKFATNYTSPNYLYLRVYYSDTVSYLFACKTPSRYTSWSPIASSETERSYVQCPVITAAPPAPSPCGSTAAVPVTYHHVVVIMLENRTWSQVGGTGFGAMPDARAIAGQCAYYSQWLETNPTQDSLPQYIGLTSGVDNPAIYNDCYPSSTCRSTDDNIFRQVRDSGGTARTFVEGATTGCDGAGHAANVPALYYFGGTDHTFCNTEVRPLTEMDVNALPTFAMVIPTMCNNGHNCGNDLVDSWLKLELSYLTAGADYVSGDTAIFVIYDEDRPVPNLVIAPTAHPGMLTAPVASHSDALRTFEEMLGLPVLPSVAGAVSLRASAHV